ncbi:MAG: hypothetical protein JWP36_1136 [Paucimonas sp.]|nr:hypothetical protein [Paucimonas sp.]
MPSKKRPILSAVETPDSISTFTPTHGEIAMLAALRRLPASYHEMLMFAVTDMSLNCRVQKPRLSIVRGGQA